MLDVGGCMHVCAAAGEGVEGCNSTKAVTRNDDELEVDKSLYSST